MRTITDWLVAALLVVITGWASMSPAQERERVTFGPPERQTDVTQRRDSLSREVAWSLSSRGRWNLELEGRGSARVTGGLVRTTLEIEADDSEKPLSFFVGNAAEGEISYHAFSQTTDPQGKVTGLFAGGSNYLTPEGRRVISLRGNDPVGTLVNHRGFVRVDRRNGGLVMHFRIRAVHCVPLDSPPYMEYPPCLGPGVMNTRPEGEAMLTGCIAALDQLRSNPSACRLPFRVDSVTPEPQRENVNFRDPEIGVTFSEPIDLDSLNDSFSLYTRSSSDEMLEVTGEWEPGDGPSHYRFTPTGGFDLRSGIIMQSVIEGGADGVQASAAGRWLERDHDWRFSTLLDLSEADNPHEVELELKPFQVVNDAPLTRGKPTVSRVYLDWKLHEDIAEAWQPRSYLVKFELSPDHPRLVGQFASAPRAGTDAVRIHRDDVFEDQHRRQAQHTVNLFGWKPRAGEETLELALRHHDPFPRPSVEHERKLTESVDIWSHDPTPHHLVHTLLMDERWRDAVPLHFLRSMRASLHEASRLAPQFFPYREVRPRSAGFVLVNRQSGTLPGDVDAVSVDPGTICSVDPARAEDPAAVGTARACNLMFPVLTELDRLANRMNPNDTLLVFVSEGFMEEGALGYAFGNNFRGAPGADVSLFRVPGVRAIMVAVSDDMVGNVDGLAQVVLHELGHEHGLRHTPGDAADVQGLNASTVDAGIEAWRMYQSGLSGANKSSTEGNGEHPEVLLPMMWPIQIPIHEMSMPTGQYRTLMQSIEGGTDSVRFVPSSPDTATPLLLASTAAFSSGESSPPGRKLVVSGALASVGDAAVIQSLELLDVAPIHPSSGPLHAQLQDASGRVLAEAGVEVRDIGLPISKQGRPMIEQAVDVDRSRPLFRRFSVSLPYHPDASRVLILDDGRVLARRDAQRAPPEFLEPPEVLDIADDGLMVGWQLVDDDEGVAFDVAYAADGAAPWEPIQFRSRGRSVAIPFEVLTPGPRPTLRITAHDGFHFTHAELPIELPVSAPRIISLPEVAAFAKGEPVVLAFAAPVGRSEVEARVRVVNEEGEAERTRLYINDTNGVVSLFVPSAIEAPETLTLVIDRSLAEPHGTPAGVDHQYPLPAGAVGAE